MPFKKLNPEIQEKLEYLEITTPTSLQTKSIPAIKSGANVYCLGPEGSGKTTTLILTTLHKLKFKPVGSSPRALVLVENNEKALEVYNEFFKYTQYKDIRVYLADEKTHIDTQKSEIFEGVDILVSTLPRMSKLMRSNGISMSQLSVMSIDDAEFLKNNESYSTLLWITQSINKCQFVLYAKEMTPILKKLESYFMEYSRVISE
ncbi:DEAD/DEAH box helicase [Aureivirga sp. CE67]|uniref:DEAD/DEAH box helicase n=1 Tax=Aureivirga sp. CE67 TaxID=1788983 RepID=UPI0018CA3DED|nr:DEAD/DEAH box helicase [Aureivirga sp. CE67]